MKSANLNTPIWLVVLLLPLLLLTGCEEEDIPSDPEPTILIFPEMEGFSGDKLKIVGRNFTNDFWFWISRTQIVPDTKTDEEITFTIPENISSGIYDFYDGNSAFRYGYFKLLQDVDTLSRFIGALDEMNILDNNRLVYTVSNKVMLFDQETGQRTEVFSGAKINELQVVNGVLWFINDDNELLKSIDAGTSWETYSFDNDQTVRDLFVTETQISAIVESTLAGSRSMLMITEDLGDPWQTITSSEKFESLATHQIIYNKQDEMILYDEVNRKIHLTDDYKLWASRDLERFRSNNFGPVSFYIGDLKRMWFVAGKEEVFSTVDGGRNWDDKFLNINDGKLTAIHFFNPAEGMAIAENGSVIRTKDGGQSWKISNIKGEFDLAVFNSITREVIVTEKDEATNHFNLAKIKF